jgi:serine/threonine protein kinase
MTNDDVCKIGNTNIDVVHAMNILYPDKGNYVLGISRLVAFLVITFFVLKNHYLVNKNSEGEKFGKSIKDLVLPSYFKYMYFIIIIEFSFGFIEILINSTFLINYYREIYMWLLPLQMALLSFVTDGLAIFLVMIGASLNSFKRAFKLSISWALINFVIYFVLIYVIEYHNKGIISDTGDSRITFIEIVGFIYWLMLFIFYLVILFVPMEYLYCHKQSPPRRPALKFYASCNVIYLIGLLIEAILTKMNYNIAKCVSGMLIVILIAFVQPFVIFKTLQIDSQYWQGITNEKNPLREIWEQVDFKTAASMGGLLSDIEDGSSKTSPYLHFGLFKLDESIGFVSGGFSRVYFADYRKEKVALKISFQIELTPYDCKEFIKEAELLFALQHPNVVICRGISIMPPVLALVMEYCKYGSLFDYLHKLRLVPVQSIYGNASYGDSLVIDDINDNSNLKENKSINNKRSSRNDNINLSMNSQNAFTRTLMINATRNKKLSSNHDDLTTPLQSKESMNNSVFDLSFQSEDCNETRRKSVRSSLVNLFNSFIYKEERPSIYAAPHGSSILLNQLIKMASDAIKAIAFLHSKGYLHCDLKSLNFLVCDDLTVKLTDFGEVKSNSAINRLQEDRVPQPARNWCPPELLSGSANGLTYSEASDIYGLTVVVAEILISSTKPPFEDCSDFSEYAWYLKLTNGLRLKLPNDLPFHIKNIIEKGWSTNPIDRPAASEMLEVIEDYLNLET